MKKGLVVAGIFPGRENFIARIQIVKF